VLASQLGKEFFCLFWGQFCYVLLVPVFFPSGIFVTVVPLSLSSYPVVSVLWRGRILLRLCSSCGSEKRGRVFRSHEAAYRGVGGVCFRFYGVWSLFLSLPFVIYFLFLPVPDLSCAGLF